MESESEGINVLHSLLKNQIKFEVSRGLNGDIQMIFKYIEITSVIIISLYVITSINILIAQMFML